MAEIAGEEKTMNWASVSAYLSTMDMVLLGANLLLLLFSRPLLKRIFPESDNQERFSRRLNVFRIANIIAVVVVISNAVMHPEGGTVVVTRTLGVLLAIYIGWLCFFILSRMIRRRWGHERKRGEETVFIETYNSRLLTLMVGVVISIVVLVAVIRILGYSSLLEAGGVLGVLGVMLALTQASWVPDLVSGLVILNSRLIEEGDIIQLGEDNSQVGMVFRTKVFFTEILHLANNHRILIQNSKLRNMTVHNLSRFASAKGLREALSIKVSYTVHVVLGVNHDWTVDIIHMRRYEGMVYDQIIEQIITDHKNLRCTAMASDFGVGAIYNLAMREKINPATHLIMAYSGPNTAVMGKSRNGVFNQWSVNRTETISHLYLTLKQDTPTIRCYNYDDCAEMLDDFMNLYRVPTENSTSGAKEFKYRRHGSKSDDTLHAVNFAYTLVRLLKGEPLLEDKGLLNELRKGLGIGIGASPLSHIPPVVSG